MGEDRSEAPDVRRTTVAEAAEILGISAEAVRGRIRRGTLPVEREGGTVYVLVDHPEEHRTTGDQSRTTTDQPTDRTELLIAEMQDRIRSLEEANRENRRIIAALTSRIPELEAAPADSRPRAGESPEAGAAGADSKQHQPESSTERSQPSEPPSDPLVVEGPGVEGAVARFTLVTLAALGSGVAVALMEAGRIYEFFSDFAAPLWRNWLVLALFFLPAPLGFLFGRRFGTLDVQLKLFNISFVIGIGTALVAAASVAAVRWIYLLPVVAALGPTLITIPIFANSAALFFVFGAFLGRARRRQTAHSASVAGSPTMAESSEEPFTPRKQAMIGLVGTIITALFSLIGVVIQTFAGPGGNGGG